MAINYISLTFGYVESSTVASMLLQNHSGKLFTRPSEALESLALYFLEKWKEDHDFSEDVGVVCPDCCAAWNLNPKPPKFCPDCGKRTDLPKFDVEEYEQWLNGQLNQTADGWGGFEGDWWPWGNLGDMLKDVGKGDCVLQVVEHAAKFLVAALPVDKTPSSWQKPLKEWQESFIQHNSLNRLSKKGYTLEQILNKDPSLKVLWCP